MLVVLVQFVLRLAIGLSLSMLCLSHRQVDSGFYRVHMWILLGLFTFTVLATAAFPLPLMPGTPWRSANQIENHLPRTSSPQAVTHAVEQTSDLVASSPDRRTPIVILLGVAACISYAGAVLWLYEQKQLGKYAAAALTLLGIVGAVTLCDSPGTPLSLRTVDAISAAGLLGTSVTAMLLGHWYLNSPGMKLAPLFSLIRWILVAAALRAVVVGWGLLVWCQSDPSFTESTWLFLGLRWVAGLGGVAVTGWMALQTLLIPNTQSATGILYVSVILAFLGELTAQLLSIGIAYPL
ncbi:MAG: hypothetical protein O3C60_16780 [Planctomycetota bacterium]|nr:hypothetical protein [Planctomycetota bacterium]